MYRVEFEGHQMRIATIVKDAVMEAAPIFRLPSVLSLNRAWEAGLCMGFLVRETLSTSELVAKVRLLTHAA